ncbi:MAG: TetM/TetW/TetO/TetS family tetracycline resistance ribosomal protection protein [Bacteroidales bacterium]|nr:TetM/TetW/TetO/TetS family tetracycline resistance ribosomal protection protein [Bacteroidales bacterium]
MPETLRNIAILAHADAGKTSITEQMLLLGGVIKKAGNVDNGSAFTDFLPVEKERGISVRSAQVTFSWKGIQINLIDTPGHVDFSADVERTLRAVDGAILVISAVEGVQAHTEALYRALENAGIPVIIFINKIDRLGADIDRVLDEIRKELRVDPFVLQHCSDEGEAEVHISPLWSNAKTREDLLERLVATHEGLLNAYFEGTLPVFAELDQQLRQLVHSRHFIPLLFGSAKYEIGLEALLDAVISYLPPPTGSASNPFSALVYGIEHDRIMGKVALVRVLEGKISTREVLKNVRTAEDSKVIQVRKVLPGKHEEIGFVDAGNIAGLCGLSNVRIGDFLGSEPLQLPPAVRIQQPLFIVQVKAINEKDYPALAAALQELAEEDPSLEFEWLREEAELQLKMMGWIQMEVMEKILLDRFSIAARFENPTVIYKETPSSTAEGFVRYWMPKPCWAILKFLIEPGELGSGVNYSSAIGVNDVLQKYQNEVERTIPEALKQGIKGWEVTDIKITLIEGEDHEMHSRPGDFVIATPMGIMDGLVNTGTTLLEPMIRFRIQATEDLLGAITSDITRMRGSFESPEMDNGRFILHGLLPVSTSLDYPVKLSSRSGGKARISTHFHGYQECPDELGVIRPFRGISPLDTAKYILKARKALQ